MWKERDQNKAEKKVGQENPGVYLFALVPKG